MQTIDLKFKDAQPLTPTHEISMQTIDLKFSQISDCLRYRKSGTQGRPHTEVNGSRLHVIRVRIHPAQPIVQQLFTFGLAQKKKS
jgi:hypothetical protein